jgi:cytochrome c biogenesis protein CcmG/thiol:disulfide interchange protein DsbE
LSEEAEEPAVEIANPAIGQKAPDFSLRALDGQRYELRDLEGQVVLLNFWATWCGPCRLEMPLFEQYSQDLVNDGLIILAINLQEAIPVVQDYVEELGLTFPVLLDSDGKVSQQYRIIGYPSSILIDRTGQIQVIHIGIITEAQLVDYLQQLGIGA